MVILGLTGPIGHGKSTFAESLAEYEPSTVHFESGNIVAEVAQGLHDALHGELPDPYNTESLNHWLHSLPDIIHNRLHVTCSFKDIEIKPRDVEMHPVEYQKLILHVENLHRKPEMTKNKITQKNKDNYRPFLQWLGGYLVAKIDSGIWFNEILRRINDVSSAGAKLCVVGGLRFPSDAAILRSAGAIIVGVYRPGHLQSDTLDPTERERNNIKPDCIIRNTGSVEQLDKFSHEFLEDLAANKLKATYQTTR